MTTPATDGAHTIHADDEDEGIADIYDDDSTQSARSSIYNFRQQYGRSYHTYKDGQYHRPNDEVELDRLDLWDAIFRNVNGGQLYLATINPSAAHRVLDIGTGTGQWPIDVGDLHEAWDILGVDLSPSMPAMVPPNVHFEITDIEDDWTFKLPFTYIHSRYMAGSVKDWPKLISQCFQHLQPGGFAEFIDFDINYYSQDGTLTADHALSRWMANATEATKVTGRVLHPGGQIEGWMREAGFVDIEVRRTPLPIGQWPRDLRWKEIGVLNRQQLMEGLSGLSYRLYIDLLGWSKDEVELLLMEVRKDLRNRKIHAMFDLYTVWGRRPV